ncbi:hypothetical protein ISG33_12075 [Glaciecola sp. MH2013]|uniref:hypothetical protein n=1 Tax=Glaciecola sp. MH2013 TaxID=2785524 RepID=UPI00189DEA68|nr:hypothetical protein [Glaciecola sp. MH2013]MBF7074138.1 hypothetical protein [Glaciecola sp. MH2013]
MSNIIYFVGGGADKTRERFGFIRWGPTHLMGLVKAEFDAKKGPHSVTKYFGYLEKKAIIDDIVNERKSRPNIRIHLVGHSRGGTVVKDIAMQSLPALNIRVQLVASLDPVKTKPSHRFSLHQGKQHANFEQFMCVFAKPKKRDFTDFVAMAGGQYGIRLKDLSDHFVQVDVNHGKPYAMMSAALDDSGITIEEILLKESRSK